MPYGTKAVFCFVSCLVIFSMATLASYDAAAKSGEIKVRGAKVVLSQGEAVKATLTTEKPTSMNDVSFSAKSIGLSNPFANTVVPFTVEVYESDELVASESFTSSLGDKFENVNVEINNSPKLDERYKMLIRYDHPEDNSRNNPIQIDIESIKVNGGKDGIDVQGRVSLVFSNF
jgi:hypothetical protein